MLNHCRLRVHRQMTAMCKRKFTKEQPHAHRNGIESIDQSIHIQTKRTKLKKKKNLLEQFLTP